MASTSAVVIPKVVKLGFIDFKVGKKSATAVCKFCKSKTSITEKVGTTSNFVRTKINQETDDCLSFWMRNRKTFDKLFVPAIVALSIPAASAPTE